MNLADTFIDIINTASDPKIFFTPLIVLFFLALFSSSFWRSRVSSACLVGMTLLFAFSMLNPLFLATISKPDNIPVVAMLFLVAFCIWLGMKQAVNNDDRLALGREVEEKEFQEKTSTWPDLLYIELIALVLATVLLIIWSLSVDAPLEGWANPTRSPNPSKAPWYFLGLQEMLVYFDPWIAGVIIPGLIVLGLISIPYIDRDKTGSGYYSFSGRKSAVAIFLFGFMLWTLLIVIGTFLRGPNWNLFGPFEYQDPFKAEQFLAIQLSDIIWVRWFGQTKPEFWLHRECFGITALLFYLGALPWLITRGYKLNSLWKKVPLAGSTLIRFFSLSQESYTRKGKVRHYIALILLLLMIGLLIKMYLRWIFDIKYIVSIPEYFFNI